MFSPRLRRSSVVTEKKESPVETAQMHREVVLKELTDLGAELKGTEEREAVDLLKGLEYTQKMVKGIRLEQEG